MRVLHIESGRHLYGGARQVGWLIDGLDRLGVENHLLCLPAQPLATAGLPAAIRPMTMHGDADVRMLPRIARQIAACEPAVVHVHSRRGADLWGGLAARLAGVPAVLTRRVDSAEPSLWLRIKCRPYAAVVAISAAVDAQLAGAGIAGARRRVVPSAVDAAAYRPRSEARARLRETFRLPPAAPVVAVVAQLIPRKGHADTIAALAALPRRHADVRCVLFGQGMLRERIGQQIAAAGLAGRFVLAGYRDDLAALLPGADVLLHAAHREGLGVAVLEAMSACVPVVAARAGGLPDLIRDGVDGRLVPAGDPGALAAALAAVLDDPAGASRLGAAARARVEREFSIGAMARAYADLYRQLTASDCELVRS